MNNEQKRYILDLLKVHRDSVADGVSFDRTRTVLQELEFVDELLQHPDLHPEPCLAGFVAGEFSTDCDLYAYHPMPHEGQDPMDDRPGKRVQWEGGGFCAGDPLPYRNVRYVG